MKSTIIAILIGLSMLFAPCIGMAADVAPDGPSFDSKMVDIDQTATPETVQRYSGSGTFEFADFMGRAPAADIGASNAGQVEVLTDDERRTHTIAKVRVSAALLATVHASHDSCTRGYLFAKGLGPSGRCAPARAFEPRAFASVSDSRLVIRSIL